MPHRIRIQRPRWLAPLLEPLEQTLHCWLEHEGPRLAASLSLYSLLSLAPLVVLTIALASLVFGRSAAETVLVGEAGSLMGRAGASTVRTVLEHAATPHASGLASAIGLAVLLLGASSVFGELHSALNKIWGVKAPDTDGRLLPLIRARVISLALVLGVGILALASLAFSVALAAFGGFLSEFLSLPRAVLAAGNAIGSFVGLFVLIALTLRYVPDVTLRWRDVWRGALAIALLFNAGKALLGLYLGTAAVATAYGAAGSLIVVILWVYYSAMIFYFGVEYTRVRAIRNGHE